MACSGASACVAPFIVTQFIAHELKLPFWELESHLCRRHQYVCPQLEGMRTKRGHGILGRV